MGQGYLEIPGWTDFEDVYQDAVDQADAGDVLVEVGVCFGKSAVMMAEKIALSRKRLTFYAVDTWDETPDVPDASGGAFFRRALSSFLVQPDEILGLIRPLRTTSWDASRMFRESDPRLSFVFIDGGHAKHEVEGDLLAWWNRLRVGGVLAGHDYRTHASVREAVDGWARSRGLGVEVVGSSWRVRRPPPKW